MYIRHVLLKTEQFSFHYFSVLSHEQASKFSPTCLNLHRECRRFQITKKDQFRRQQIYIKQFETYLYYKFQYAGRLLKNESQLSLSYANSILFSRFFISRSKTSLEETSRAAPMSHSTEGSGWLINEAARATFGRTWFCKVRISHRELSIAFDCAGSRSSKTYGSEVTEVAVGLCKRRFRPGCLKVTLAVKLTES